MYCTYVIVSQDRGENTVNLKVKESMEAEELISAPLEIGEVINYVQPTTQPPQLCMIIFKFCKSLAYHHNKRITE